MVSCTGFFSDDQFHRALTPRSRKLVDDYFFCPCVSKGWNARQMVSAQSLDQTFCTFSYHYFGDRVCPKCSHIAVLEGTFYTRLQVAAAAVYIARRTVGEMAGVQHVSGEEEIIPIARAKFSEKNSSNPELKRLTRSTPVNAMEVLLALRFDWNRDRYSLSLRKLLVDNVLVDNDLYSIQTH
jgi:hypothetical protein